MGVASTRPCQSELGTDEEMVCDVKNADLGDRSASEYKQAVTRRKPELKQSTYRYDSSVFCTTLGTFRDCALSLTVFIIPAARVTGPHITRQSMNLVRSMSSHRGVAPSH